jgi:hypothetical protein
MRYDRPAIERRVPITGLLGAPVSPPPDDGGQPIWRRGEKSED